MDGKMKKLLTLLAAFACCTPLYASPGVNIPTPTNVGGVLYATGFAGADWCAKVTNAVAALPDNGGTVMIDKSAGNTACAVAPTLAKNVTLQFVDEGPYTLSDQLDLQAGDTIFGVGSGLGFSSTFYKGTQILWTGAGPSTSKAILNIQNAFFVTVHDLWLDGGTGGVAMGIHYWSQNNPPTSQGTIERVVIRGAHHGITVGEDSNTGVGTKCFVTVNQAGCYEADYLTVDHVVIYGNATDTTAESVRINSANGAQETVFSHIIGELQNKFFHVVQTSGFFSIEQSNAGSWIGSNPVGLQIDPGSAGGYYLNMFDTEGAISYTVHDSSCAAGGITNSTWVMTVSDGGPNLVDGCSHIVDLGTKGAYGSTVSGAATVVSVQNGWTTASGFSAGTAPRVTNGGSGYAVGDILTATDGTCTQAPQFAVITVNGSGTVQAGGIGADVPGVCTVMPSGTAWSGGSGTGLQVTFTQTFPFASQINGTTQTQASDIRTFGRLYAFGTNPAAGPSNAVAGDIIAERSTSSGVLWLGSNGNGQMSSFTNGELMSLGGWGITNQGITVSKTKPTIASGFCTSPSISNAVGTAAFSITVGSSCAAGTATLTMPAAQHGWACTFQDITTGSLVVAQSSSSTTSVGLQAYSRTTGATANWTSGDTILGQCTGY